MKYVATIHFSTDHPEIASSEDFDFFALQADVGNLEVTDFHIEPLAEEIKPYTDQPTQGCVELMDRIITDLNT